MAYFHYFCQKQSKTAQILYYRGAIIYEPPCTIIERVISYMYLQVITNTQVNKHIMYMDPRVKTSVKKNLVDDLSLGE